MDASESSVIARKLKNFYVSQHHRPAGARVAERSKLKAKVKNQSEPGIFRYLSLVVLMGTAVFFTEVSLTLVRWARRLEKLA